MNQLEHSKKKLWMLIIFNIFVCFLICCAYMRLHFSADGFSLISRERENIGTHIQNGRYIAAGIWWMTINFGIHPLFDSSILIFLFIVLCGWIAGHFAFQINQFVGNGDLRLIRLALIDIGVLLTFINCYINDWYGFPESALCLYGASLIAAYFAAEYTIKSIMQGTHRYLLLALICLAVSYNCYQVTIGFYVFYVLLFIWITNEGGISKKSISEVLTTCLLVVMVAVGNLIIGKMMGMINPSISTSRYDQIELSHVKDNVSVVIKEFLRTWKDSNSQLPDGLFLFVFLTLFIFSIISIWSSDRSKKSKIQCILTLCIVLVGGWLCVYVPHLLTIPVWITNRTIVFVFCSFAVFTAVIAVCCKTKWIMYTSLTVAAVFTMFNAYSIHNGAQEVFAANAIQQNVAMQIRAKIDKYESDTGIQIENVGVCSDEYPTWTYPFATQTFCEQVPNNLLVEWNRVPLINYYCERNFKEIEVPTEIYDTYFAKDWFVFMPEEQMIFSDNNLYICMY